MQFAMQNKHSFLPFIPNPHATWWFRGPDCSVCVPSGCSEDTLASSGQSSSSSVQGHWRFVFIKAHLQHAAHSWQAGILCHQFCATLCAQCCRRVCVFAGGLSIIARQEGVRGLYRGLTPTLVALLPNWAVSITAVQSIRLIVNVDLPLSQEPYTSS